MTTSTNLGILQVAESQSAKATAANTAIGQIESALSDTYSLGTTTGTTITIPFVATNDLSNRQALRLVRLILTAGATASFTVVHPDNKHLFLCQNDTTQDATVKTLAGTGILIPPSKSLLLYCDGVNVIDAINRTENYDVGFSFTGLPTALQVIARILVPRGFILPINMAGSVGNIVVNPTASYVLTVNANGTAIGTVTVDTSGVFTFATTGGIQQTVSAGALITVEAPTPADTTADTVTISMLGSI